MVERETWKKLNYLMSNNGGEYISRGFEAYCSKHVIRHVKIVPNTPQHDSVANRMNHIIIEKVGCMLKIIKLSKVFWVHVA